MKPLSRLLLVIAVMAMTLSGPLTAHAATTFSDDFNSGPLNTGAWKTSLPWNTQYNSNHELEWYNPANLSFLSGGLRITTLKQSMNGYPYTSGVLTSQNRYSYGYYEFRAKMPKGQGIFPALWLLADGTHEIDVMELLGNDPTTIYMTYHRGGGQVYQARYTGPDFSAGYHTYAVDWQPSYIRWYVDGVKRGEYTGTILSTGQNIVMNTAVGDTGSWPGPPNSSTVFPQYLDVDYIHVYPTMADATTPPAPPANTAPAGNADSYSTNQDTALSVAAPGVLANDTDAQNDLLTASLVAQPAHGTLALNSNGSFIYTPAAGYVGSDSFSYQASDGGLKSAVTTVNLTVKAVNHAPVASADSYSVNQDSQLNIAAPGVLGNDSDPDGNTLTAAVATQPSHGTVSLPANGSLTYTPAAGYVGSDSFTYKASDGSLSSAAAAVSITVKAVNHAPVASADSYATTQGVPVSIAAPGVLGNDSDPDGNALTAAVSTQPSHGTVVLNSNGSFVYTPATGWSGTDSFTYRTADGSLSSAAAVVSISVAPAPVTPPSDPGTTPVNPPAPPVAPVSAANDAYNTNQGVTLTVAAPGVLANDSGATSASVVTQPANGKLTFNANGSFTYVPNAGFVGTDSFTYRASSGTTVSAPANVTLNVKKVRGPHWRARQTPRNTGSTFSIQSTTTTLATYWSHVWGYLKHLGR